MGGLKLHGVSKNPMYLVDGVYNYTCNLGDVKGTFCL